MRPSRDTVIAEQIDSQSAALNQTLLAQGDGTTAWGTAAAAAPTTAQVLDALALKVVATNASTIYVDSATGNDNSADPTNPATPYASLDAALRAVAGLRARDYNQEVTVSTVGDTGSPRTYTLSDPKLLVNANNVIFNTTQRVSNWSGTIASIAAAATATGGLTVQGSGSPGWTPGTSLRTNLLINTTENSIRPTSGASAADTLRLGGANTGVNAVEPVVPSGWTTGNSVSAYVPGVIIDIGSSLTINATGLKFRGVTLGAAGNAFTMAPGSDVTVKEGILRATPTVQSGASLTADAAVVAPNGTMNVYGTFFNYGTVFDTTYGGALVVAPNATVNLSNNNVIAGEMSFTINNGSVVSDPGANQGTNTAALFYQGAKPITTSSASTGSGAYIGLLKHLGKLGAASGNFYISARNAMTVVLGGAGFDAVETSGGSAAKISADGGVTESTFNAATGTRIVGAATTPALGQFAIGYDFGIAAADTVYQRIRVPFAATVSGALCALDAAPTGGTFTLKKILAGASVDVTAGSTILAGASVDLTTLASKTDTALSMAASPTVEAGDSLVLGVVNLAGSGLSAWLSLTPR